MAELVYFELNNMVIGDDYPNEEPFITWMGEDIDKYFNNDEWAKENKLCVVHHIVDTSTNFCITATKEWVDQNCPGLMKYTEFLREYNKDFGKVIGRFETPFLDYTEENIGVHHYYDEEAPDGNLVYKEFPKE